MASGTGRAAKGTVPKTQFAALEDPEDVPTFGEEPTPARVIVEKPERTSPVETKTGPPTTDEWQDFFARFVIKLLTEAYLMLVLGDLLDELSPMELKRIVLTKEDMKEIAAPLAEMSAKSGYMRKHGRTIIAAAESYESVMTLLLWMNRVNRIAKKHRKDNPKPPRRTRVRPTRQETQNAQSDGNPRSEVNGVEQPHFGVFNPGSG